MKLKSILFNGEIVKRNFTIEPIISPLVKKTFTISLLPDKRIENQYHICYLISEIVKKNFTNKLINEENLHYFTNPDKRRIQKSSLIYSLNDEIVKKNFTIQSYY